LTAIQLAALALVAVGAPVVVLTRQPLRQALVVGVYGFALAILFFTFQAPDVALSEIVVATVAVPLMALLALVRLAQREREK
jgi:energy-converting hydrogenase B subunit D